jgi:hypothetical protein
MKKIIYWIKNLFSHNQPTSENHESKEVLDYIEKKISSMSNEEGYNWLKK